MLQFENKASLSFHCLVFPNRNWGIINKEFWVDYSKYLYTKYCTGHKFVLLGSVFIGISIFVYFPNTRLNETFVCIRQSMNTNLLGFTFTFVVSWDLYSRAKLRFCRVFYSKNPCESNSREIRFTRQIFELQIISHLINTCLNFIIVVKSGAI